MVVKSYINELKKLEQNYKPNSGVASVLAGKYLVFVVGPAKVGKSTLMNNLVALSSGFSRIGGLTTRSPRPDDETELYRYLQNSPSSFKKILNKAKNGDLVQYAIHPTTGNVYATELSDYTGLYNCKDVLGHAMAGFRALPSAASYTFSIVCEPTQWLERLKSSYSDPADSDLQKRIAEAKINLAWSLKDENTIWIDNSNGNLEAATAEILNYCTKGCFAKKNEQDRPRQLAFNMIHRLSILEFS